MWRFLRSARCAKSSRRTSRIRATRKKTCCSDANRPRWSPCLASQKGPLRKVPLPEPRECLPDQVREPPGGAREGDREAACRGQRPTAVPGAVPDPGGRCPGNGEGRLRPTLPRRPTTMTSVLRRLSEEPALVGPSAFSRRLPPPSRDPGHVIRQENGRPTSIPGGRGGNRAC